MPNVIFLRSRYLQSGPADRTPKSSPVPPEVVERLLATIRQTQMIVTMAEQALSQAAALDRYLPASAKGPYAERLAELGCQLEQAKDVVRDLREKNQLDN